MTRADNLSLPVKVIHGVNDPSVLLSRDKQLIATLKVKGIGVELLVFANEGYRLFIRSNKLIACPAIIAFLDLQLNS